MAITAEENQAYLDAIELRIRYLALNGDPKRISHSGATTSREIEMFQSMTVPQLMREAKRVRRLMGSADPIGPLYP